MSTVSVDTSASSVGVSGSTVLAGLGIAVVGGFYLAGFNTKNLSTATLAVSAVIVGVMLWLMLTDVKKLGNLIMDNQMVALGMGCVLGLELVMHGGLLMKYPAFATV
jgi:hypothetical protein